MGFLDRIKSMLPGSPAAMPGGASPAAMAPAAPFQSGSDGTPRLAWARYGGAGSATFGDASFGSYAFAAGHIAHRNRSAAASISTELLLANPTLATLVETLTTHAVGTGLRFSSKLDAAELNITEAEAERLANDIERAWASFADNPVECDLSGRFTLHEIAAAAFRSYLLTGEVLATIHWVRHELATCRTKVNLLQAAQIDQTRTQTSDGLHTFHGVAFNANGELVGYWLREIPLGAQVVTTISKFTPAKTPWGRPQVVHVFEQLTPGQIRGLSPLAAALTPAHERNSLGEFTLASALIQTQFALTVESDLPPAVALGGLAVDHGFSGGTNDPLALRSEWYRAAKITAQPGVINHLAPGDKLKINRTETPNSTFDAFDQSLTRQAARAAGASVTDVSGNFGDVNFSASRMESELPYRLTLRRRRAILEKFYQAVFSAWLEEAIERRFFDIPRRARSFYDAPSAWARGSWLGAGRVSPDPLKAAQATVLEVTNNLSTLQAALAERGLDLEEVLSQRAREKRLLERYGLTEGEALDLEDGETAEEDDAETAQPSRPQRPAPAVAPSRPNIPNNPSRRA